MCTCIFLYSGTRCCHQAKPSVWERALQFDQSCYSQVFVTVTLQGAGLLQVNSDLFQVLDFRLQRLDLCVCFSPPEQNKTLASTVTRVSDSAAAAAVFRAPPRGQCAACGPSRPAGTHKVQSRTWWWRWTEWSTCTTTATQNTTLHQHARRTQLHRRSMLFYVYVSPVCDFVRVGKADGNFSHAAELVVRVVLGPLRPRGSAHCAVVAGEGVWDGATVAVPGVTLQRLQLCTETHCTL